MTKTIVFVLAFSLGLGLATVSVAAEGAWTTKADMPTGRYVLSSSVVEGKIYAIGGDGGSSKVEEYDPVTNTWTRKANMPMTREAGASSAVNGKIYVMGGAKYYQGPLYSSVLEYDAATDTWTNKTDIPTPRACLSSSVVNGKIYAIGGAIYQSRPLSTVEEYDPATDTWTSKADMPTPRTYVSTSVVNGRIYAIGGALSNPSYQGVSTVEEYDPATDTWTKKADMPTPRTYFSTCVVNGKIYAIGGVMGGNHLSQVEEYDPATDTWTRKADMPSLRAGLATSAVNGKVYAIGGWTGWTTVLSTLEVYDPNPLVVDFNGNGTVDIKDLLRLIEAWGQDDAALDIGPTRFGDGVVDAADLEVLMGYWGREVDDPTLKACWKLDETEGDIAYDSAAENDAALMGDALWQPDSGMVKGALQFDGLDDCVKTPFKLNPAEGEFSVFAWINGGAPGQVILSQEVGANWLMAGGQGVLRTDIADPVEVTRRGAEGGRPLISQTVVIDGDWHRVGFVWDGIHRILYVDDIEVARDTVDNLQRETDWLNIGVDPDFQPGAFWSGMIDDVRVYERVVEP